MAGLMIVEQKSNSVEGDYACNEIQVVKNESDLNRRLNKSWCLCEQCPVMPNERECCCCRENDSIRSLLSSPAGDFSCLTQHPSFDTLCLNSSVLEVACVSRWEFKSFTLHEPIDSNELVISD